MKAWLAGLLLVGLAACGEDNVDDPEAAKAFLSKIQGENYRGWSRAPGWEARKESIAVHGNESDIYVNKTLSETPKGATAWPEGSIIVKDSFQGSDLRLIAAMEKRADGWYFVEWDGGGEVKFAGRPSICTDCHSSGQDEVLAFGLPR
ncbi:MAG: cytochrome P460 family protein [Polyangiaceae bacterium]|jgi:hypothetical protein|nr:cytochrome P460 family protein [Polyangiaceae bacterium]